ncbi:hypothetical protein [Bartonella sp. CB175]|uniref:hypothetical protein n=1 Tax=Bartonella sp. CB175 TaxID=3112256 RepID=UPI00300DE861
MPEQNSEKPSWGCRRDEVVFCFINLLFRFIFIDNRVRLSDVLLFSSFEVNLFTFNVIDQLCE